MMANLPANEDVSAVVIMLLFMYNCGYITDEQDGGYMVNHHH